MRHSQAAQFIESMRMAASQVGQVVDGWNDKTRPSAFQPVEHNEFEMVEASQTSTNDLESPVSLRGDMLVW